MRTVDSKVYTKKYYLSDCTHYQEFLRSNGLELGDRFVKLLPYVKIKPGMRMLDVGSGRGELCIHAASKGAEAVGIDYSAAAINLANEAKKKLPKKIQSLLQFNKVAVTKIDFPADYFDIVVCVEVLEHLYPEEIELMLEKVFGSMKPGAIAIFHTAPNKLFNSYGYRYWSYPVGNLLIKLSNLITGNHYPTMQHPDTLRTESHKVMHVNEPTWFSLRKHFNRKGFEVKIRSLNITAVKPVLSWKDILFNVMVYFDPISRKFPLNVFFGDDFLIWVKKVE